MDQALTIHDSILRSMLGKHYGFEVGPFQAVLGLWHLPLMLETYQRLFIKKAARVSRSA